MDDTTEQHTEENSNLEQTPEENQPKQKSSDESLVNEVTSLQEKLLRQIAETENLRRRYEKQIEDAKEYSAVSFAKDLLSVVDNLSRTLEHQISDTNEEIESLLTGVRMTHEEMNKVLAKHGVEVVSPAMGDIFDYNLHYAISYEEGNSLAPGQIAGIMQVGYKMKDRLLRPAIVTVTK